MNTQKTTARMNIVLNTLINNVFVKNFLMIIFIFTLEYALVIFNETNDLQYILNHHWQILDIESLRSNPLRSIIYTHTQPPLLNLIIGILAQFPGDLYNKFIVINCFCIAVTAIILYKVIKSLTLSICIALIFTILYIFSPGVLLNTAYPFYPSLTTCGYALLIFSFYLTKYHFRSSVILFIISNIYLSLLRSSFSPLHILFIVILYFYYIENVLNKDINPIQNNPIQKTYITTFKKVLLLFLIAMPILIWNTKNWVMYDFWGATSWAPVNLAKGFGIEIRPNPFPTPSQIQTEMPEYVCSKYYDTVDYEVIKKNGSPNYNSCYFLNFSKSQSNKITTEYNPYNHIVRVVSHIGQYFSLPDEYEYLTNKHKIEEYRNIYNNLYLTVSPRNNYEIRLVFFPLILIFLFLSINNNNYLMRVISTIFIIHFLSHVLTDGDEGKRFVFDIEFIFYIMSAYVVSKLNLKFLKIFKFK